MKIIAITLLLYWGGTMALAQPKAKPKVWIYSDMSDKSLPGKDHHTVNDPDDISAMAGYLLMMNQLDTKGIVVASTHRAEHKTTGNQADWATGYFGKAYRQEVNNLNKALGGFPATVSFVQSCIKESAERFKPDQTYSSLQGYSTIQSLFELARQEVDTINVLCWGSLTEPAILVRHCLTANRPDVLKKLRFIGHWTSSYWHQGSMEHPEHVANCREDAAACSYMKQMARDGKIQYYECGAIGQHGIVSGSPKGDTYYNQFKVSQLGTLFAEGKFAFASVDHSDAATYWVLLGQWGVSLNDLVPDGSNTPEREKVNEEKFTASSTRLHNELLRRAKLAGGR